MNCPELLYAIHNKELESELFDEDGNLNIDEDGNLTGEVDRYFGENSNIRPFLFIPETQDEVKNYVCYQTSYSDLVRYNDKEKNMIVTFTIFVNGKDSMDKLTGIPRHDLIASIIREKFAWIGLEISTTTPFGDKESIDKLTNVPRHDLIASIIREKFAWIGLEISTTTPFGDRESTTDNDYLVRTLQYEVTMTNSICKTH